MNWVGGSRRSHASSAGKRRARGAGPIKFFEKKRLEQIAYQRSKSGASKHAAISSDMLDLDLMVETSRFATGSGKSNHYDQDRSLDLRRPSAKPKVRKHRGGSHSAGDRGRGMHAGSMMVDLSPPPRARRQQQEPLDFSPVDSPPSPASMSQGKPQGNDNGGHPRMQTRPRIPSMHEAGHEEDRLLFEDQDAPSTPAAFPFSLPGSHQLYEDTPANAANSAAGVSGRYPEFAGQGFSRRAAAAESNPARGRARARGHIFDAGDSALTEAPLHTPVQVNKWSNKHPLPGAPRAPRSGLQYQHQHQHHHFQDSPRQRHGRQHDHLHHGQQQQQQQQSAEHGRGGAADTAAAAVQAATRNPTARAPASDAAAVKPPPRSRSAKEFTALDYTLLRPSSKQEASNADWYSFTAAPPATAETSSSIGIGAKEQHRPTGTSSGLRGPASDAAAPSHGANDASRIATVAGQAQDGQGSGRSRSTTSVSVGAVSHPPPVQSQLQPARKAPGAPGMPVAKAPNHLQILPTSARAEGPQLTPFAPLVPSEPAHVANAPPVPQQHVVARTSDLGPPPAKRARLGTRLVLTVAKLVCEPRTRPGHLAQKASVAVQTNKLTYAFDGITMVRV